MAKPPALARPAPNVASVLLNGCGSQHPRQRAWSARWRYSSTQAPRRASAGWHRRWDKIDRISGTDLRRLPSHPLTPTSSAPPACTSPQARRVWAAGHGRRTRPSRWRAARRSPARITPVALGTVFGGAAFLVCVALDLGALLFPLDVRLPRPVLLVFAATTVLAGLDLLATFVAVLVYLCGPHAARRCCARTRWTRRERIGTPSAWRWAWPRSASWSSTWAASWGRSGTW